MKITTCLKRLCLALPWASALPLAAHATPAQTQCPSQDFNRFLSAFSSDVSLQSAFQQHFVRKLTLRKSAANEWAPYQPMVDSRALHFPLMKPADVSLAAVDVTPDGKLATYTDKRAGLGNIKVYTFKHTNSCWLLSGIEDWSVRDDQLSLSGSPGLSVVEQRCMARAGVYGGLGGPERYPLTAEFYQASMDYLVCAAASGDPQISLSAAGLGLSGMAAFPGYGKTEQLFLAGVKGIPDAAVGLAEFYCDGGDASYTGACLAPGKAQAALLKSANTGSAGSLLALGEAYQTGKIFPKDLPRALACSRAALTAGDADAQRAIDWLLGQGVKQNEALKCLPAQATGTS